MTEPGPIACRKAAWLSISIPIPGYPIGPIGGCIGMCGNAGTAPDALRAASLAASYGPASTEIGPREV